MRDNSITRKIGALVGFIVSGVVAAAALLAGLTRGPVELNPALAMRGDDPLAQVVAIGLFGMPAALALGFAFGPSVARAARPMGVALVVAIAAMAIPIGAATGAFASVLSYSMTSPVIDPAGLASGIVPMALAGGILGTLFYGSTAFPIALGVVATSAALLRRIERHRLGPGSQSG